MHTSSTSEKDGSGELMVCGVARDVGVARGVGSGAAAAEPIGVGEGDGKWLGGGDVDAPAAGEPLDVDPDGPSGAEQATTRTPAMTHATTGRAGRVTGRMS
jgi:hypothetical protein